MNPITARIIFLGVFCVAVPLLMKIDQAVIERRYRKRAAEQQFLKRRRAEFIRNFRKDVVPFGGDK